MALVKISELTAAATLTGTEAYPLTQNGVTKKAAPDPPGTYAGLDISGRVSPAQVGTAKIPVIVSTTDATANTAAINAALVTAQSSGRPTNVVLQTSPNLPGLCPINDTLTLSLYGVWLEAETLGSTGGGVRLAWEGAVGGEMVTVTAANAGVRRLVLDAKGIAATCIRYNNGERMGYEDLECANFTGSGVVIGNGVANNNGFRGKGTLYARGKPGSVDMVINCEATEDINLDTVELLTAAGNASGLLRHLDLVNGAVLIDALTVEDDFGVPGAYAIRVQAGSFGINDLVSEQPQTLTCTAVNRSRGSYILRGDLRSCNVQAGQYAMELQAAGDNSCPFLLGGIRVNRKAGAAETPNIRVNESTTVALGVYFTSSDAGASGTFTATNTGFLHWISDNGGLINGPIRWDSSTGLTKILGLIAGSSYNILNLTGAGNIVMGADTGITLAQIRTATSIALFAAGVECLRTSNDNAGRVYFPSPKVLLSAATDLEIDGPLNHDGTTAGFFGATPVTRPTAPTAADAATVDATYGAEEAGVINNMRTRLGEIETKLRALGLIT